MFNTFFKVLAAFS